MTRITNYSGEVTTKELLNAALALSEDDRVELAAALLESVPGGLEMTDPVRATWVNEVNARLRAIDEGRATLIPADEALTRVQERLRRFATRAP